MQEEQDGFRKRRTVVGPGCSGHDEGLRVVRRAIARAHAQRVAAPALQHDRGQGFQQLAFEGLAIVAGEEDVSVAVDDVEGGVSGRMGWSRGGIRGGDRGRVRGKGSGVVRVRAQGGIKAVGGGLCGSGGSLDSVFAHGIPERVHYLKGLVDVQGLIPLNPGQVSLEVLLRVVEQALLFASGLHVEQQVQGRSSRQDEQQSQKAETNRPPLPRHVAPSLPGALPHNEGSAWLIQTSLTTLPEILRPPGLNAPIFNAHLFKLRQY